MSDKKTDACDTKRFRELYARVGGREEIHMRVREHRGEENGQVGRERKNGANASTWGRLIDKTGMRGESTGAEEPRMRE